MTKKVIAPVKPLIQWVIKSSKGKFLACYNTKKDAQNWYEPMEGETLTKMQLVEIK